MDIIFKSSSLILFQGDSITDCGRNRVNGDDLGDGYTMLISAWLSAMYPQHNLKFLNRGISAEKVRDLIKRWDEDCIALKPDWVSILVGINDALYTPIKQFEEEYHVIVERISKELDSGIILCEPFFLSEDPKLHRDDLDPKIEVVHRLAKEYSTILVPLDKIFQESCSLQTPQYWAPDGVHPSLAGHALIAQTWIKCVQREIQSKVSF